MKSKPGLLHVSRRPQALTYASFEYSDDKHGHPSMNHNESQKMTKGVCVSPAGVGRPE